MSIKGVYLGFFLPLRVLAASVARRPSVLPLASITNHLRVISCELGKYVDIVNLLLQENLFKARLTHRRNLAAGKRSRKRKVQNRLSGEEWIQTGFTPAVKTLKALLRFAFLAGYLGSQIFRSVCGEAAFRT